MVRFFMKNKIDNKKKTYISLFGKVVFMLVLFSVLSGSILTTKPKEAEAWCVPVPCWGCDFLDCAATYVVLEIIQELVFSPLIEMNLEDHVNSEQNWIVEDFFEDYWVKALAELTEYLSAFGMKQMEMFGMFMDAKIHLETRRLFLELQAEAHRDYHPSDEICWMGTAARSLAASETKGLNNLLALNINQMSRNTLSSNNASSGSHEADLDSRWKQFVRTFCDPRDNGWSVAGTGMDLACDHDGAGGSTTTGATNPARKNADIDYSRVVDDARTINVDFTNATFNSDEEDILALSKNIYGHKTMEPITSTRLKNIGDQKMLLFLRSVIARRNVAQTSFNAIIALKSSGSNGLSGSPSNVGTFLGAVVKDLMPAATTDAEIYKIIGENPSYYAQLEVLAKKIYQNPEFFADLYDKPANVSRKSVAMKAIDLLLDRALQETQLRQEMLMSVLLSTEMRQEYRLINRNISPIDTK